MKIFICTDKSGGLLFGGRRLSQDSILRKKMLELGGGRLHLNSFSAKQFETTDGLVIDDNFLSTAKEGDCCFVENVDVPANAEGYYIFNWNRDYPADTYFELDLKALGYKKVKTESFAGSSHKKITLEIYSKV